MLPTLNTAGEVSCNDRTLFVPPHKGPNIFPNCPLFNCLFRHAARNRLAIRDLQLGVEKTYQQLLSDALALREVLRKSLGIATIKSLDEGEEVYIGVLAGGGYEFAVAMLAVISIGAAAVPMSVVLPVKEAAYFVSKSRQCAILTASASTSLGSSIVEYVRSTNGIHLSSIEILKNIPPTTLHLSEMVISSDKYLSDNSAGLVIFTSGTTGPPKGAVARRSFVHDVAMSVADFYQVTHEDVVLHLLPIHHATGLGVTFFPFIISGACIEFRTGGFDPGWTWERFRRGGISFFSGVPTIYMRMMRFYEQHIANLELTERNKYIQSVNNLRVMASGSSALPKPIQDFWSRLRDGRLILQRYGATEFGAVFKVSIDDKNLPDGSVGRVVAGIDVKLSDGDQGEVLVKNPYMFAKYLFDDAATKAAHDSDGYFRTGDIARREGAYYWILGRASIDIIKSGGYKISALDIEREILGLSYVSEVSVVGVEDDEFGQRVGAIVSLRGDQYAHSVHKGPKLSLDTLRKDLKARLAGYKLPTLLRLWGGELPKGQTGKVVKKQLIAQLFPSPGWQTDPNVQVWRPGSKNAQARL